MKEVTAPASKSDAHRALFCAALSDRPWSVVINGSCDDIEATRRCAAAVSAWRAAQSGAGNGCGGEGLQETVLDVGESGATLRFALPVAAALGQPAAFRLHGRLPERPLSPLRELLEEHGAVIAESENCAEIRVSGQLTPGEYRLPGNVSSQFISGLLLALPLLPGDSRIVVTGALESAPYIDMTLQTLRRFGVTIRIDTVGTAEPSVSTITAAADPDAIRIYTVPGCQRFGIPEDAVSCMTGENPQPFDTLTYAVEGDWSAAANWIVAGVIGPEPVLVKGLSTDSAQGDRGVVDILQKMGADVEIRKPGGAEPDRAEVIARPSRSRLRGIRIDASQTPDLVPILALAATQAEGVTEIYNAERLRLKESDRLQSTAEVLQALGFDVAEKPSGLIIHGTPQAIRGTSQTARTAAEAIIIDTKNDHRIAMMVAVASIVSDRAVVVRGGACVAKSYPAFFTEFGRVGSSDRLTVL
ncbi:MAG: 3-phosphoshikimate 1-carboxyvinyltransferase [Mogibacterium sp.]|nr:3-phosphoshikimate 1-carboxyvinyltransferase [Mogibacterium sp.]